MILNSGSNPRVKTMISDESNKNNKDDGRYYLTDLDQLLDYMHELKEQKQKNNVNNNVNIAQSGVPAHDSESGNVNGSRTNCETKGAENIRTYDFAISDLVMMQMTADFDVFIDLNSKRFLFPYIFKSFLSTTRKMSSCFFVSFTSLLTSNPFTVSFM